MVCWMKRMLFVIAVCLLVLIQTTSVADEVVLKNGDRVTGEVVEEDEAGVTVETDSMGRVTIARDSIDRIAVEGEEPEVTDEEPRQWKGEVAAGANRSTGNTETEELSISAEASKITEKDEINFKGSSYYSSSKGAMDAQKWYVMGRYGRKIWNRKWVSFSRLEADHDKFAGIYYRLIPSAGLGYWFADTPEWKAMTESALGYEITDYNNDTGDTEEPVLILRVFVEKTFSAGLKISNDTSVYPSLEEPGEYRVHSETAATEPLGNGVSIRLSYVVDHDSDPPEDLEETDTRLMASVVYSF